MQDDIKKTEESSEVDTMFEALPEEVQNFLMSPLFEAIMKAIATELKLDTQQSAVVKYLSYELLLKTITPEDGYKLLIEKGVSQEIAVKILYSIDTEVVERAKNITEFYTDVVDFIPDDGVEEGESSKVSPLSSLADRLKQASIATPVARNYSLDGKPMNAAPTEKSTRAIDPYHEAIDNE